MIMFCGAVAKAKDITIPFDGHLPRLILELVACARHLGYVTYCDHPCRSRVVCRKSQWHFVVVDLDANGDDAKPWVSQVIEWRCPDHREPILEETSDWHDPAFIAGILASWVSMLGPVVSSTRVEERG